MVDIYFNILVIWIICWGNYTDAVIRISNVTLNCDKTTPTFYKSFLTTENEKLIVSCSICGVCENVTLPECQQVDLNQKSHFEEYSLKYKKLTDKITNLTETITATKDEKSSSFKTDSKEFYSFLRHRSDINQENQDFLFSGLGFDKPAYPKIFFTKTDDSGKSSMVSYIDVEISTFYMNDLLIFRKTSVSDTGRYDCIWNGKRRMTWLVTVKPIGTEPYREIFEPLYNKTKSQNSNEFENQRFNRPLNPRTLPRANLQIFTEWTEWSSSQCSLCSLPGSSKDYGFQMRIGTCMIKAINELTPVHPQNFALFQDYTEGIPCRSHVLTLTYQVLKVIARRPSEIMFRTCHVECKPHQYANNSFQNESVYASGLEEYNYTLTLDKSGNIYKLDSDGNTTLSMNTTEKENIFKKLEVTSRVDEFKPPNTGTTQMVLTRSGSKQVISCPLKFSINGPIAWFRTTKDLQTLKLVSDLLKEPMDMVNLSRSTKGRWRVDPAYNLVISEITKAEKGVSLSCMHNGQMAGLVKIVYIERPKVAQKLALVMTTVVYLSPLTVLLATLIIISLILKKSNRLTHDKGK